MVNYSNGLIYKLVCKDIDIKDIYVGSTTNFNRRKQQHKSLSSNPNSKKYNFNVYQFIRQNGGWDNFDMIEVEKYSCNDRKELHSRERYWFETLQATLNKWVPNRSNKQYKEDNKEKIKKYHKQHYEDNKEKRQQKKTCECGSIVSVNNLQRHFKTKKHQKFLENKHSI